MIKRWWRDLLMVGGLLLTATTAESACLKIPAPSQLITSTFGWRFHPVFKTWRMHRGADFRAPIGDTLTAAHGGVVQVSFSGSGGNEIRILGEDGVVVRYLHLTRALVSPGTRVQPGQQVALSGNTGHASAAPHLHFEVYQAKQAVNPEPLLCPAPGRKAGADKVNGFPVLACNPEGGSCQNVGTLPNVGSTQGAGTTTASTASDASPTGLSIESFDDMSANEILISEIMKRYANPDWITRLNEYGAPEPLLQEMAHMDALGAYLKVLMRDSRERREMLMANRLARQTQADAALRLSRQRALAARAAARGDH